MFKFALLILCCSVSFFGRTQDSYANLTVLLKNVPVDQQEKEINKIYNRQSPKTNEDRLELKFWKFYVLDSLGFDEASNSLAQELLTVVPKLKSLNKFMVYRHFADQYYDEDDFKNTVNFGLKIVREKGISEKGRADALRLVGLSYSKLDQLDLASNYLLKSVDLFTKINSKKGMASAKMTLGNVYKSQKKYDEALKTYQESLILAEEINDSRLMAGNFNNMGSAIRNKGNVEKAVEYFEKALKINIESGNKSWESFNYNNLANCYTDLNRHDLALEFFKKSTAIKLELGDSLALIETYSGMSNSYAKLGQYKKAYDYLYEHNLVKSKFDLTEQARELAEMEGKYNTEKKEIEIAKLKTQKELEQIKNDQLEMKAQRNRVFFILIGCISLLLMAGIIWLVKSNRTRQRLNDALVEANKDISRKSSEIIDSINYATQIQRASLPDLSKSSSEKVNFALFFAPKDIVSGDFFFSYHFGSKLYFGLGDCTGHGVPGAMVSLVGLNAFEKTVNDFPDLKTSDILEEVNKSVIKSLYRGEAINDGMDVSFCTIHEDTMRAHFTGANHSAYLLRKKSLEKSSPVSEHLHLKLENLDYVLYQIDSVRRPVGKSYSKEAFFEVAFDLYPGDRIIMGTDGYADQFGGDRGKKLKKVNLVNGLISSANVSVTDQMNQLKMNFEDWKGQHEQVDDVCLLITEVC